MSNTQFSVFIDSDNSEVKAVDFFKSKNASQNFKRDVKNFLADDPLKTVNLNELTDKYVKDNKVTIQIKEQTSDLIRFVFSQPKQTTQSSVPDKLDILKQTLKERLKVNNCIRSNRQYAFQSKPDSKMSKDEQDKQLDNDIILEYSKIVRMFKFASNIPSPKDIFAKPNEYREAVNFIMNNTNGMRGKLPPTHPYIRYFTLLKEKMDKLGTTN